MNIYALSSGSGVSGIAVVRVSGKEAADVLKQLTGDKLPTPKMATLKKVKNINTNELIDEAIIIWFPGPDSYTGEDLVEFHVHGGVATVSKLLAELGKFNDCRLAKPGEFTRRALENGNLDLNQVEALSDLIAAETEMQRKQAMLVLDGQFSKKGKVWKENLLRSAALLEASIDFSDVEKKPLLSISD